ncbi:carboxypeptidase-like regulatory domain-containing protein [Mesonia sp. HuA40]|uniref:carboxypeptidase-like regulatory domain-containing protein n=1 Tax=Mesonia sp. HuA40 TaxID=2602761 RepID=UPI0011C89CD8|nr:carboxypeptidase-like regulatory domain-containing protein [Mesonia sp. HuA40]TXK71707.1 carboxypeptidase-like regulatory domain-containing protein [Mesonia sp. HuA40]
MNRVTKINLSNLKKCNQVWADMPENEKGRLCLKCSNTIIDFRNMTDSEIAKTHLFSEQKVCGLYNKEQLAKPKQKEKNIKINYWNSFYFGLFSFLSFSSYSQEKTESVKTEQTEKKYDLLNKTEKAEVKKKSTVKNDSIYISGRLTDNNSEPLPYANVIIKGTHTGVTSDFDGVYRLNITKEIDSLKKITLIYSYIGFVTTEITVDYEHLLQNKENRRIDVEFKEGEIIEFVVYERAPFHKRVWNGIKNIFRKKKQ